MIWRRSEWISFSTFIILITWIWYASGKVNNWDGVVDKVKAIEPVVTQDHTDVAILKETLSDMREDLRYLRRHARP